MADGRVFVGHQAIEAGLVDGISTLEELISKINNPQAVAGVAAATQSFKGVKIMNVERLRAEHGDLVEQIEAEAREGHVMQADVDQQVSEAVAEAREQGAAYERARIQAVEEQLIPGHEALIGELKFDGKTTGPEAAQKVLAAEKSVRTGVASQLDGEAGTPVPAAESSLETGIDTRAPFQ